LAKLRWGGRFAGKWEEVQEIGIWNRTWDFRGFRSKTRNRLSVSMDETIGGKNE